MDTEKALKELSPKVQIDIALNVILEHCCFAHFGSGEKELVEHFMSNMNVMHPTHQQDFGRFLTKIILHFAEQYEKKYCDMRNEAFCKMCYEMKRYIEEHPLPRF